MKRAALTASAPMVAVLALIQKREPADVWQLSLSRLHDVVPMFWATPPMLDAWRVRDAPPIRLEIDRRRHRRAGTADRLRVHAAVRAPPAVETVDPHGGCSEQLQSIRASQSHLR